MRNLTLALLAFGCFLWLGATVGGQPGGNPFGGQPGKKKAPIEFEPRGGIVPPYLPARVRWEYRVETVHKLMLMTKDAGIEAGLNKLGSEGWELIAIDPGAGTTKPARDSMYVLRRAAAGLPKADPKPAVEPAPKEKAEPRLELRLYHLRNANAVDMAQLIGDALALSKYPLRVVPESRTNQIVVNGPMEAHLQIETLLERLDAPGENEKPKGLKKKNP